MELNGRLIGFSGYATTGKDTIFELISKISKDEKFSRIAFADQLKKEINPFLNKNLGISSFTKSQDEKRLIRPMLVAYGEAQRKLDPDYWVKKVEPSVNFLLTKGVNVCITDVRYDNEARWVSSNGILVHIKREGIVAPNESELKNLKHVKKNADLIIDWPNTKSEEKKQEEASKILKEILNAYNRKFKLGPVFNPEERQATHSGN